MEKKEIGKSGIKISALGIGTYGVGGFETRDESKNQKHEVTSRKRWTVRVQDGYGQGEALPLMQATNKNAHEHRRIFCSALSSV